jgi:hypothetical protein
VIFGIFLRRKQNSDGRPWGVQGTCGDGEPGDDEWGDFVEAVSSRRPDMTQDAEAPVRSKKMAA